MPIVTDETYDEAVFTAGLVTPRGLQLPHPLAPARPDAVRIARAILAADTALTAIEALFGGYLTTADAAAAYETKGGVDDKIATAIAGLLGAAPGTLDTLNELAAALGDDPNFAATIAGQIAAKADADHNHDALYYAKAVIDAALAGKASTAHAHGDLYYTKDQVDAALSGVGGGTVLLDEADITATVAAVEFAGNFDAATLFLHAEGLSAGTLAQIRLALSDDDGATWATIAAHQIYKNLDGTGGLSTASWSAAYMPVFVSSVVGGGIQTLGTADDVSFLAHIYRANAAAAYKVIKASGFSYDGSSYVETMGRTPATMGPVNRLKVYPSTGSFDTTGGGGRIKLYGVN